MPRVPYHYFLWSRSVILGSADTEHPRLMSHEIRLFSKNSISSLCDYDISTWQTDSLAVAMHTALCVASRG